MGKPMIGVLPLYDSGKESYWMLPGYMKGIEEAGGIPVMLPMTADEEMVLSLADRFDGFLFTGGHDLNPSLYDEEKDGACGEICEERDRMESILLQRVFELDKPAFGICRGLQLFNALLGGTLYQDLPTQFNGTASANHKQRPPYTEPAHPVTVVQGTLLHRIVQSGTLQVNSYHHQGIKKLAERLEAAAYAEDGLVEAVVKPDNKFVLAVQWHPEFNYKLDARSSKLFTAFVGACR